MNICWVPVGIELALYIYIYVVEVSIPAPSNRSPPTTFKSPKATRGDLLEGNERPERRSTVT